MTSSRHSNLGRCTDHQIGPPLTAPTAPSPHPHVPAYRQLAADNGCVVDRGTIAWLIATLGDPTQVTGAAMPTHVGHCRQRADRNPGVTSKLIAQQDRDGRDYADQARTRAGL